MMQHFTPSISNDIPSMGSGITSLNPTRKHESYFYVLPKLVSGALRVWEETPHWSTGCLEIHKTRGLLIITIPQAFRLSHHRLIFLIFRRNGFFRIVAVWICQGGL